MSERWTVLQPTGPARTAGRPPVIGPVAARRAATCAVALLMLSGLSFAGGLLWIVDLTAAFRVHYAVAGLVLGVVLLLARWRAAAAGCFALAVVHGAMIVPFYLGGPPPPVADGEELQVMVLNTKIRMADADAVIAHLRRGGPDIAVFLATNDRWVRAIREADIPYRVLVERPSGTSLETFVIARHDVRATGDVQRVSEGGGRGLAVTVSTWLDGEPVELLAIHPHSPLTPSRARINTQQLGAAALWSSSREVPHVVVGDLNATPWSPAFRALQRQSELVDSQIGHGLQPTWPTIAGPFGLPIDHVLHSRDLTTVRREVGRGWGSDHASVTVTLARAAPESSA